ncbi:undecaprenyl pyrophosphate synthetase [Hydrogenoanaerobacterium saccharovorans]|uniref:Isoprenyl transferase n=1 Tax=Hydrogenoanaerobacterium saccharovorans TaxID=474960 RepID=A0A1H7ZIX7_9FIRM|nr:isoprenyl transferase [Hydrogenoanaerobacterium saccharovorans]RPF48609.1 undecaprenyl pyrophosphate synthetase [Hydrogenoanaerobacterium saccharovorans]SEM57498.1 Undecaprenyl pyrophosphate synthetase [Hydrogenoanaerobacterium saccharovorans]
MKKEFLQPEYLPQHIGIIMDGNGRWAKKRGLPRSAGHKKGANVFGEIARYCRDIGIRYLTVYAFSTENWSRPESEVRELMSLLKQYLRDTKKYKDENIKLLFLGDRSVLDDDLRSLMFEAEQGSRNNTALTVCMAINYGGRDEIRNAVQQIARKVQNGSLAVEDIDETCISNHLYTANIPDPDVIIRPSGEKRSSNFLAWQSAYSEYVFMDILWPDFTTDDLNSALWEYSKRSRRFGGVLE